MDLHIHSIYSDGKGKIDEIARKAKERGLKVIAIVDHSLDHPLGLNERKAIKRRIEMENAESKHGIRILDGVECAILENGELLLPRHDFDLIIASIHSALTPIESYRRIKRCVEKHEFHILGHLHAGMFSLDGFDVEKDAEILDILEENDIALELNSYHRSPPYETLKLCENKRLLYSFASDAHEVGRVGDIDFSKKVAKIYLRKGRNLLDEIY